MFQRLPNTRGADVRFFIDGEPASGLDGDTVAAALLLAGRTVFRQSAVSGVQRGPYCLMGACHDCYVEIDGIANRQACLVQVRDGMKVSIQRGKREPGR
ncbi:(2Fe-2S)-binding protein [Aliihoeflea sp. PC F10.4]